MVLVPENDHSYAMTPQMQDVINNRVVSVPTPQMQDIMEKRLTTRPNIQWVDPPVQTDDAHVDTGVTHPTVQWVTPTTTATIGQQTASTFDPITEEKRKDGKFKVHQKLINTLQIVLKLAAIQAYDNGGRIQDRNGHFIPNSSIINLITHAMSPGKILVAEEEILTLLFKARVDPNLLLNENMRAKLTTKYNSHISPRVETRPAPTMDNLEMDFEQRAYKRPREADGSNEVVEGARPAKRKAAWIEDHDD